MYDCHLVADVVLEESKDQNNGVSVVMISSKRSGVEYHFNAVERKQLFEFSIK